MDKVKKAVFKKMEVIDFDEKKVVLQMTGMQFSRLLSIVSTLHQEYGKVDEYMLDVPKDEVKELNQQLSKLFRKYVNKKIRLRKDERR